MHTERQRAFIIHFLYACILVFLAYILFRHVIFYIMPFFIGFAIAFSLRPIIRPLSHLTHGHEKLWSLLVILLFYAILAMLLAYVSMKGYFLSKNLLSQLPHFYEDAIEPFLQSSFHQVQSVSSDYDFAITQAIDAIWKGINTSLASFVSSISQGLIHAISSFLTSLPHLFLSFFIAILSSIFFTSDYSSITNFLFRQFSPRGKMMLLTIRHFVMDTFFKMVIANLKLMVLTFVQLWIGLLVLRIENAWLIALGITLFDALPILGTGAFMLPWALLSWINALPKQATGLLIVYFIVACVRSMVEPKIMSRQLGLHPILMLLCMYVGARLFGFFGFMCLPMVLLVLQNLNEEGFLHLYK